MSWPTYTLENICTKITDGAHNSPPSTDDGFPMASVKDMTPYGLNLSSCRHISSDDFNKLVKAGCKPEIGDVLIAKDGNSCLQTACIQKETQDVVLLSSVAILRPNKEYLDSAFLKFHLDNPNTKATLNNFISGAAIPRVVLKDFRKYSFEIPPLNVQQKIGSILSGYNDLIENNLRRIGLLENAARLIYKEWFVKLNFPGREHTKIVDGVPEGWTRGPISDFYNTSSGGTPSRKNPDFFTGNIRWVKTQELQNGFVIDTDEKITEEALNKSSAKLFPSRSILVAMYGATIGQLGILAHESTSNQACCAVMPKEPSTGYTLSFLHLRENKVNLGNLSQGAAQNNINQQTVRNFDILMPAKTILATFNELVEPQFELILKLQMQIAALKRARDLLLPKLMSGEIAV